MYSFQSVQEFDQLLEFKRVFCTRLVNENMSKIKVLMTRQNTELNVYMTYNLWYLSLQE